MKNNLIYAANFLNPCVNNSLVGCKFPVKWNNRKKFWFLDKPEKLRNNYYFRTTILKFAVILTVGPPLFWLQAFPKAENEPISKVALFVFGMEYTLYVSTTILDIISYLTLQKCYNVLIWIVSKLAKYLAKPKTNTSNDLKGNHIS